MLKISNGSNFSS